MPQFGSINISRSDSQINREGIQINTNWTNIGGKSTLSLNVEKLPASQSLNLICQNIPLKIEDSISYVPPEGEGMCKVCMIIIMACLHNYVGYVPP